MAKKYRRRKKRNRGGRGKMSFAKRMFLERAGWKNKHHMLNRCNGGRRDDSNMLLMDERRHSAFHLLFQNLDFLQVAKLLVRTHNMKKGTSFCVSEN